MSNEQWKTNGDCSKCRRKKYCSKDCNAKKRALARLIKRSVSEYMAERIFKGSAK